MNYCPLAMVTPHFRGVWWINAFSLPWSSQNSQIDATIKACLERVFLERELMFHPKVTLSIAAKVLRITKNNDANC